MIGEFAFQLLGAKWSGIRLLGGAIAANAKCAVHRDGSFTGFLTGKTVTTAEDEIDEEKRTKLRIDNFHKACWRKAGDARAVKWGHQTMVEDIGGLLDGPGAQRLAIDDGWSPERSKFNAIDYFVCRCLRVPAIFIVRDGRAAIPAAIRSDKATPAEAVARWKFSVHVMKRVAFFTEKSRVIRFEELVLDPRGTIVEVCRFLGIVFDDAMLKDLPAAAKNEALLEDIDPPSLARQTARERWLEEIQSELADCGYLE